MEAEKPAPRRERACQGLRAAEHSLRAAASGGQPEEGVGAPAKSEVFQAERAPGKFSGFRRLFWIFTNFVKAFPELFFLQKVMKMSTF